jgi:limonene-1,2-epoxide hydrolase
MTGEMIAGARRRASTGRQLPRTLRAVTSAETVERFIQAIERRDLDAAMALLHHDCEYDNVPIGPVRGHAAIRSILEPVVDRSDEVRWPVQRSAASDTVVFNERLDRFRVGERWIEIAVTGVWEVHDGLITLWRDYFDLDTYRRQQQS